MKIQLDFNNIKVKEQKKDFTVKILMLKGEKGEQGDLNPSHIVDNLTSTDSSKVLSAKQGKVLKDLVDEGFESLNNNIYFNKQVGCTTFFRNLSLETMQTQMSKIGQYFSCFKQQVRLTFDTTDMEFKLIEADNINNQITVINEAIQNGANFKGLHFYQPKDTMLNLFQTYGSDVIMGKYYDAIVNFIDTLPYKNQVNTIWLLNEVGPSVCSTTYENDIIKVLNDLKELGYEVSTPTGGAYNLMDYSENIVRANSFISLNSYPKKDIYGENSSIKDVAERYNKDFRLIERYLSDMELCISETGCSSSWDSFTLPETYKEDGNGKPIALFIEGLFQSELINYATKGVFLWYYADAYKYAPYTLLSIKNNREVRYNE